MHPLAQLQPKFSLQGQCTSECNIRYSQDFLKLNMRKLKLSQISVEIILLGNNVYM